MTNSCIERLASSAIQANDNFNKLNDKLSTVLGVVPGGVVIDCVQSKRRLALVTVVECPDKFGAAIGSKEVEESEFVGEFSMDSLASLEILRLMEKYFVCGSE